MALAVNEDKRGRSSTLVIFENHGAPGYQGVGRKIVTGRVGVPFQEILHDGRVSFERAPGHCRDHLRSHIVSGRSQASSSDDQVIFIQGSPDRGLQTLGVVANYCVAVGGYAQLRKLTGQEAGVGIQDLSDQQLSSHGDYFCRMCCKSHLTQNGHRLPC